MQKKSNKSSQKIATWKKNFDEARKLINQARQSIEQTLSDIEVSMMSGEVDIQDHIIDASIWNDIGGFFITRGMPSDAELTYRRMFSTEIAVENKQGKPARARGFKKSLRTSVIALTAGNVEE
jgi:hypothetical protein